MSNQISLNSIILNTNASAAQSQGNSNIGQVSAGSPSPTFINSSRTRNSVSPLNDLGTVTDPGSRNIQQAEANIPSASLACPSPDEIIIKGRGRRSLPVKWSPIPIESPQKLPPSSATIRSPRKGLIALRSSPRKRLQLSDPVTEEIHLSSSRKALLHSSPLSRKYNGRHSPFNTSISEPTLSKLSHKELVDILNDIIKKHPEIESEIELHLPKPVLKIAEVRLVELKKQIQEAVPNDRTDSVRFCKVIPHLSAMKQVISEQCQHLESVKNWGTLLDFVVLAWPYVRDTPVWDSEIHQNFVRNPCFKILAHHSLVALKHINIKEKDPKYIEFLYERLQEFYADHNDVQQSIDLLQKLRSKS